MLTKAILFDLDGVILDSEKIYSKFWLEAAVKLGYGLDSSVVLKLRSCDSTIARSIVDEATGHIGSYDGIRTIRKQLMSEYMKSNDIHLKPGVKEFLNCIADLSLKKVIVTSASPDEKYAMLTKYGIADFFDDIVSVKDVIRNKPFPDVYRFACKKLGFMPGECYAIEDSPNGIISAYDAGVHVIMIPDLTEPDEDIKEKCLVFKRIDQIPLRLFRV